MRHAIAVMLLLAFLAPDAAAQAAPAGDAEVQAARSKPCVDFLKEVATHQAAGGEPDATPSFVLIWGWLLARDPASGDYMGKRPLGHIMFDNTFTACQRMRARTLGATMDAEYGAL